MKKLLVPLALVAAGIVIALKWTTKVRAQVAKVPVVNKFIAS